MVKWIISIILLAILVPYAAAYFYAVDLRRMGISDGRVLLRKAAKDYSEHGYVTNHGRTYQVWLSTNLVTIDSTQYHCFFNVRVHTFYNQGTLAMTTNQTFVWLDAKRPAKVIAEDYRPPLFPPRF